MAYAWFAFAIYFLLSVTAGCQSYSETKQTNSNASDPPQRGAIVYAAVCASCHDTGERGAPKLSDNLAWKQRAFEWKVLLKDHAMNGFLDMPPMGAERRLSQSEVEAAVDHIVEMVRAIEYIESELQEDGVLNTDLFPSLQSIKSASSTN